MKAIAKILSAVTAAVLLCTLSACLEDGEEPTKEPYGSSGAAASAAQSAEQSETFGLNETAVFQSLKISAAELKESTGESFFTPEEGKVFVGVNFTVENVSDEEQTVSSMLLFDAYVDDVACSYSFSAAAAFGDTVDGTIAPGKKLVGWYAVEVPEDWQTLELHVVDDWLSSSKAVFVFSK